MGFRIKTNERAFLAGMTGSGKTYLAMHLLAAVPRLVVIDHKGSDTITRFGFCEPDTADALTRVAGVRPVRVRVRNTPRALEYMAAIMTPGSGGGVVYIDEVYAMVPPRSKTPPELNAIWTRGRELGVGGWAATQRPSWLPLELISEADWNFCFRLRLDEDRARMAGYMGKEVETKPKDEHGFWLTRADWEHPVYHSGVNGQIKVSGGSK